MASAMHVYQERNGSNNPYIVCGPDHVLGNQLHTLKLFSPCGGTEHDLYVFLCYVCRLLY
jgi:hypothetical protein